MRLTFTVTVTPGDHVRPEDLPAYAAGVKSTLDRAVSEVAHRVYPELVFSAVQTA